MAGADDIRNEITGGTFFSTVIQGRNIIVQLPPEITPALSGIPSGNPAFTGRETDLDVVLSVLAPALADYGDDGEESGVSQTPTAAVVAVSGIAGVGKTELAIQAARTAINKEWFAGGVLFVDMFGYDPVRILDPSQALDGFLRALAVPGEHIPPLVQDRARLYTSMLAAYAREGRRILVVIDNAFTHEQAKPLLPSDTTNAAIVTSRDTLAMLGAQLLDLNALTVEDAAKMLDRAMRVTMPGDTRITDDPSNAARLAQLCGGLPIALQIVAALLSEDRHRSLTEMVTALEDEHTRLDELSYAETTVRAAFELSYNRLDPEHARLFRLISINPGPEISIRAAAVLASVDPTAARRGLEVLARAHMIDRGSRYGQWRMHDLLRLYARQLSDVHAEVDRPELARDRLLSYYLENTKAADSHLRALPEAPVTGNFDDRDSALAWLDAEWPNLIAASIMAGRINQDQVGIQLASNLAEYLTLRRRFDELLATSVVRLNAARRLGYRGDEAGALTSLGGALSGLRRFEDAITAHEDALAIFRETGERHGEGIALGNLSTALGDVRRFEDAITAHEDALAIFRETGDRQREGMALTGTGLMLAEVRRFEEAIADHQEAVTVFKEIGDRYNEGIALGNLGTALGKAGRVREAITALRESLTLYQENGDQYGAAVALENLGTELLEIGNFEEAITVERDAATIFREINDRYREGTVLVNLGAALAKINQAEEAITVLLEGLAICREVGDRHSEAMTLNNLGAALSQAGRFEAGITAFRESAEIFREIGDQDMRARILSNLGDTLGEAGKFDDAITARRELVEIFREVGDRRREAMTLNNLGATLAQAGRLNDAITVGREAAVIFREIGDQQLAAVVTDNLKLAEVVEDDPDVGHNP